MHFLGNALLIIWTLFSTFYHKSLSINLTPCSFKTAFVRTSSTKVRFSIEKELVKHLNQSASDCFSLCNHQTECFSYFYNGHTSQCILVNSSYSLVVNRNLERDDDWNFHRKLCLSEKQGSLTKHEWIFEKVSMYYLNHQYTLTVSDVETEDDCIKVCLAASNFTCRSALYDFHMRTCSLSRHNRRTFSEAYRPSPKSTLSYLENQCIVEPSRCTFRKLEGYKMLDSKVYQSVSASSKEECEFLCAQNSAFACRSYLFDGADGRCKLSPEDSFTFGENSILKSFHDGSANSAPKEPGKSPNGMNSEQQLYEKSSCIDVKVRCEASSMVALIKTSGPFRGRLFTLSHPYECYNIGHEEAEEMIALSVPLHAGQCGTVNLGNGTFTNSLVIQQHPLILRDADRRIEIACDYQRVRRKLRGGKNIEEGESIALTEVVTGLAPTPPLRLKIMNSSGSEVRSVELGDLLYLKVEMTDESIFGIFGSQLVARSGEGSESLVLIDDQGCPLEPAIFPGLAQIGNSSKSLVAPFQAFRFASDTAIKFQMIISFCLDTCQPATCGGDVPYEKRTGRSLATGLNVTHIWPPPLKRRKRWSHKQPNNSETFTGSNESEVTLSDLKSGDVLTDITLETGFYVLGSNHKKQSSQFTDHQNSGKTVAENRVDLLSLESADIQTTDNQPLHAINEDDEDGRDDGDEPSTPRWGFHTTSSGLCFAPFLVYSAGFIGFISQIFILVLCLRLVILTPAHRIKSIHYYNDDPSSCSSISSKMALYSS